MTKSTRNKIIAGIVVGAVVVIAGGWFGFWWVARHSADNRYQVTTHTQGYQQSLIDQERDRIQGYDESGTDAQKLQLKDTFCSVYQSLTAAPQDLVNADARICG